MSKIKKFFGVLICFLISFAAFPVKAAVLAPFFNIEINETAVGEDNSFEFHIRGLNPGLYFTQDPSLIAHDGAGSFQLRSNFVSNGDQYLITADTPSGWSLTSAECTSVDPMVTFAHIDNGVIVNARIYSSVNCSFVHTKQTDSKHPILIVPGLFGTEMSKGGTILWADISRMVLRNDSFMDPLQFKSDLTPLDNSIELGQVMREAKSTPQVLFSYDYTKGLIDLLTSPQFGYVEGRDLFTFPYDWRYGISPEILQQFEDQMNYIITQTDAGRAAGKVDIVAHSTGGLIAKKYIKEHQNNHAIGKAVFVGVPNLGAPKAFKAIIAGDNFDIPGLDAAEMKKIAQNAPIAYDLAPSQEYVKQVGSFLHSTHVLGSGSSYTRVDNDFNYNDSINEFTSQQLLNSAALSRSQQLHTPEFDNYDIRTAGVDLYNIVGCKSGTFGQFTEFTKAGSAPFYDFPRFDPGDKTVPFESVDSLLADPNNTYFFPKANHGKMMTEDGGRQLIVNLLTGSNLDTKGKILNHDDVVQHPEKCNLTGHTLKVKSPVDISITDQSGNVSQVNSDGSVQNDIPGAGYEIWGDHKYVFLPDDEGQTYYILLKGSGTGTFSVSDQTLQNNVAVATKVFSNIPVTPALIGLVNIQSGSTDLYLDTNSDNMIDSIVSPTALLPLQLLDESAPVTVSTINGTLGQPSWYRSSVSISFTAQDLAQSGAIPAGVWQTNYKLDSDDWVKFTQPLSITTEGPHSIKFYSTDMAGNSEVEQEVKFTIDKSAPEALFGFSPLSKDIIVTGEDALDPASIVTDNGDTVRITDKAGNVTVVGLSEKDRKKKLKAELVSLSYNGAIQDISKNKFSYIWDYDKNANLKKLEQQAKSKKDFNISADYNGSVTKVEGKDATGKIKQTYPALKLLQIKTNKGDLGWSLY